MAVIAIIYGGVKYITSAGDEKNAEQAEHIILYAIIGLIVISLAVVIVNFTLNIVMGGNGGGGPDPGDGDNIPGGAGMVLQIPKDIFATKKS